LITIRGATVVTMNARRTIHEQGDVVVSDSGTIDFVGRAAPARGESLDGRGMVLIPGFVQTHVHLCQTLYRNRADDLVLLDWLKKRIWPYEAALDARSLRASARLGIAELLRNGTTSLLDMGTVHHYDSVFDAAREGGIRLVGGKCLMDAGEGVPKGLLETTRHALDESARLAKDWHGRETGRLRYAYAPRFVLSCTEDVLREVARLSQANGYVIHTHASEQEPECAIVRRERGDDNIAYLDRLGIKGPRACLAHCVHPTEREVGLMREAGTRVLHCPSSNLKLASGIAPVPDYLARGVCVSLGADGAPCNNLLDPWEEMRLAALIQKPRHGPTSMPAETVFSLATIEGARALGIDDLVGSIEVGKRADLVLVDLRRAHAHPRSPEPYSQLVYATRADQVDTVLVDGHVVVRSGRLTRWSEEQVLADADLELGRVLEKLA
jgi:cytosine/adenosine deaminase-related metal-dependent hydrolase